MGRGGEAEGGGRGGLMGDRGLDSQTEEDRVGGEEEQRGFYYIYLRWDTKDPPSNKIKIK